MKRFATTIVTLAALVLLAVFLLYPLALVLDASFRIDGTGGLTLGNYAAIVKSRYYLGSIGNSLLCAALATAFACAIGIPLAFCLARIDIPGRALLLTLASLPLVLPSFVSAYALVLLFAMLASSPPLCAGSASRSDRSTVCPASSSCSR